MGCQSQTWLSDFNSFTHCATSLVWSELVLPSLSEGALHYHSSRMEVSGTHFQKFFIYMHICCHRFLTRIIRFSQDHTQSILNAVIPPFLWDWANWGYCTKSVRLSRERKHGSRSAPHSSNLISCSCVRKQTVTHVKFLSENSQLEVALLWELQMRGPSTRAWMDTSRQYAAPMTVMTFRSDERNIWKIK